MICQFLFFFAFYYILNCNKIKLTEKSEIEVAIIEIREDKNKKGEKSLLDLLFEMCLNVTESGQEIASNVTT